jgi:hypothetical protein
LRILEGVFRGMAGASAGSVLLFVGVGATVLVGIAALVVGILTLRSARGAATLAVDRKQYLREEHERIELVREAHRSLADELEREREGSRSLADELERERGKRLEAEWRAERAEQEARSEAARWLRARLDDHLKELEEKTWPGGDIRRVK